MARLGVFYRGGFDAGAYAVALYHAQLTAARGGHGLCLYTFPAGALAAAAARAADEDGLLVFGPDAADLDFLRAHARPSVVCEQAADGCGYVAPDNFDIGRTAAEHLLDLGHQRLAAALPGSPAQLDAYHGARFAGFRDTAAAAGRPLAAADVHFGPKLADSGRAAARAMLAQRTLPDAVYVQNLPMALAAYRTLLEAGVSIPDDVSFVGTTFTQLNAPIPTEHVSPPMTCVTFAKEEMGRLGAEHLIAAAEGRADAPLQELLPGVLAPGASTAPARR